jgi:hypothetical protein
LAVEKGSMLREISERREIPRNHKVDSRLLHKKPE